MHLPTPFTPVDLTAMALSLLTWIGDMPIPVEPHEAWGFTYPNREELLGPLVDLGKTRDPARSCRTYPPRSSPTLSYHYVVLATPNSLTMPLTSIGKP